MTIELPCNVGDKLFIVSELDTGFTTSNMKSILYVEENYCYGVEYHNDIYDDRFIIYVEHDTKDWGKELAVYFNEEIGKKIFFNEIEADKEVERRLKEPMYARFERANTVRDLHLKETFYSIGEFENV